MPFYQITITLKSGQVISGIRETGNLYIDPVYMDYFIKANQHYHHENVSKFSCVMISRHSQEYRDYEAALNKPVPIDPVFLDQAVPAAGAGKKRTRKDVYSGPGWGELKTGEGRNNE